MDCSIHNHTDCIYLLFYILNVPSKDQVWSNNNNNGHICFFPCILNVSSDGLPSPRTAAPSLSTFIHQLLQHHIHPILLIPVQLPIQLLGHPLVYLLHFHLLLHCLLHVHLVLHLLIGLLFHFLAQLFPIKTLPLIQICLVSVDYALYDFVD